MPSKDEIRNEIKKLEADLAAADDDEFECWVKDSEGRETKLTRQHAKSWLQKLGVVDADTPESEEDSGKEEPQEPEKKPKREGYGFFK